MLDIFDNTNKKEQLIIINAHPDLADKTKISALTSDSKKEQTHVGLDQCSEEEFKEFKKLNDKYKKKFGFPFIYAVKNKSKKEILSNFRQRISYDISVEFNEAIKQVKKIASLRLNEINKEQLLNLIPLNRLGDPNDIASMACFLLSDCAGYITGQTINVDGGMVMQ